MRVIHKYPLTLTGTQSIATGRHPVVRCVAEQGGDLRVWVEVDKGTAGSAAITLAVVGTGWDIPEGFKYFGTGFVGSLVWHVYREPQMSDLLDNIL